MAVRTKRENFIMFGIVFWICNAEEQMWNLWECNKGGFYRQIVSLLEPCLNQQASNTVTSSIRQLPSISKRCQDVDTFPDSDFGSLICHLQFWIECIHHWHHFVKCKHVIPGSHAHFSWHLSNIQNSLKQKILSLMLTPCYEFKPTTAVDFESSSIPAAYFAFSQYLVETEKHSN